MLNSNCITLNNNLSTLANIKSSTYDNTDAINIVNDAVMLQQITLTKGNWLLFGNAYVKVDNDLYTSYIVIGDFVNYSFKVAQAYKGQVLFGVIKTNVNLVQYIETDREIPIYLWCVSDGDVEVRTPTLYALQVK